MTIYLLSAFLLSIICGGIFTPLILDFCKRKRLYDIPNERKVHKNATPRLGGVSFLPNMLLASLITIIAYNHNIHDQQVKVSTWTLGFFFSLLLIYGVGLIDDLVGLGAKTKFTVQIVAATVLPLCGLYINNLYGFCGIHEIPFSIGSVLTVFVIVFISNAINLIDGIDGLAAGLSLIALSGFLVCFLNEDLWLYGILIAGLMGVLIPFIYFNMFGKCEKNRKIFMGDSGSLTLGFILGFLVVKYSMDNPNVMFWRPECMLLSYTFIIVPVFDVVRVSAARFFHRTPVFKADKNHIHHKLIRAGMTQHQALACILSLAVLFIGINIALSKFVTSTFIVAIDIIIWIMFHFVLNAVLRKNGLPVFKKEGAYE